MHNSDLDFDTQQAVEHLMRFLAVEGTTGQEEAIGREVAAALSEIGVPRKAIRFDNANRRIPLPTQTGNLIVTLPGTCSGPRRLLMTHLDTVPAMCRRNRCARAAGSSRPGRRPWAAITAPGLPAW